MDCSICHLEIEDELYGGSSKKIIETMKSNFSGIETCRVIGHKPILKELLHNISSFNSSKVHVCIVFKICVRS